MFIAVNCGLSLSINEEVSYRGNNHVIESERRYHFILIQLSDFQVLREAMFFL